MSYWWTEDILNYKARKKATDHPKKECLTPYRLNNHNLHSLLFPQDIFSDVLPFLRTTDWPWTNNGLSIQTFDGSSKGASPMEKACTSMPHSRKVACFPLHSRPHSSENIQCPSSVHNPTNVPIRNRWPARPDASTSSHNSLSDDCWRNPLSHPFPTFLSR